MAGDERVRYCTVCNLNVYNFASLTSAEVRELLLQSGGRVCARLYQRVDGTFLTSDCPVGVRSLQRRLSRLGAAVIAGLFGCLSACVSVGEKAGTSLLKTHESNVHVEIEHAATSQEAVFTGVVRDEANDPLPGVTVVLRDDASKREVTSVTDIDGVFTITSISVASYRVEVNLLGFKSAIMEHVLFKPNEITHARIALRVDESLTVTVGALAVDPTMMGSDALSTTFPQALIDKLPVQH